MSGGEELRALSADLRDAPREMEVKVREVINKGGLEIKERMIREMQESRFHHFGHISRSIDYDEIGDSGNPGVEVGPNAAKHASAALAGIAYFGNSYGGGGTVVDPRGALEAEAQEAHRWIQKIAGDVL